METVARQYGEVVEYGCRQEAFQSVSRRLRQGQVLLIMRYCEKPLGGLTASQVALRMYNLGFTKDETRNNAAPRLTELKEMGRVEVIGKRRNGITGKLESVYVLRGQDAS